MYPVDSYYISASPISPADTIGGSWVQIEGGRFICAAGGDYDVNAEGGASSASHTHSAGSLKSSIILNYLGSGYSYARTVGGNFTPNWRYSISGALASSTSAVGESVQVTGATASTSVSTLPPYIVAYIWKRVS